MKRLPYLAITGWVLLLVALVMAMVCVPLDTRTWLMCPYCGAETTQRRILFVQIPQVMREGLLSSYWRKRVEPGHVHNWVPRETMVYSLVGKPVRHASHAACLHRRWLINDEMAIAVLRALATPRECRNLMNALWNGGNDTVRVKKLCWSIRIAYQENPCRRDWRAILAENGLKL